jgi:hypothetical protein
MENENNNGNSTQPQQQNQGNPDYFKKVEEAIDSKLNGFLTSQQKLMEAMAAKKQVQEKSVQEEDVEQMLYNDPKKFAAVTRESIKKELREENLREQNRNSVLVNLVKEYPELNDKNHELTKAAVQIFDTLPDRESELSYQTAVYQAAASHGILPKSKRKQVDSDNFTMSGGSSGSGENPRKNKKMNDKVAEFAGIFSAAVGRDLSKDAKYFERLNEISKQYN